MDPQGKEAISVELADVKDAKGFLCPTCKLRRPTLRAVKMHHARTHGKLLHIRDEPAPRPRAKPACFPFGRDILQAKLQDAVTAPSSGRWGVFRVALNELVEDPLLRSRLQVLVDVLFPDQESEPVRPTQAPARKRRR